MPLSRLPPSPNHPYLKPEVIYLPSRTISHSNTSTKQRPRIHYHVFFIPGNPGCVEYYTAFLSLLAQNLGNSDPSVSVSVYGISLFGFVDSDYNGDFSRGRDEDGGSGGRVKGLRSQIAFVEQALREYVAMHHHHQRQVKREGEGREIDTASGIEVEDRVIVVGHSVGAYIGLEVLRGLREGIEAGGKEKVLGYIGLWPTVTWIGRSVRGRKIGWLLRLPFFASTISTLARILVLALGQRLLHSLIKLIARMPEEAASTTASFLSSRNGVRQALHLARDEMNQITEDKWNEEIWGSANPAPRTTRPRLRFYFGANDHWVEDRSRDELIKLRGWTEGGEAWKAKMNIDDEGVPHSFCIRHSEGIAEKTAGWIMEMINTDS